MFLHIFHDFRKGFIIEEMTPSKGPGARRHQRICLGLGLVRVPGAPGAQGWPPQPERAAHCLPWWRSARLMENGLLTGRAPAHPYLARQMSDYGFRQTLEVRTLGCARRSLSP